MLHDVVIPFHSKDEYTIYDCINSCKNIKDLNKIFIVSKQPIERSDVTWISEDIFPFKLEDIVRINNTIPEHRAGWYYQQLIKLYSFLISDITSTFLVLDSDVIFLKPVDFFEQNLPLYSYSDEYTPDYFECMKNLNPFFERSVNVSGICHHMMFETNILNEIFSLISNKDTAWRTIIENVKNWHHGFSEYELYFHYIHKAYPKKYKIRKLIYEDVYSIESPSVDVNTNFIVCHEWRRK
jgi:hypothetical protein